MTKLKVGDKAPNFSANDEQGNTVSLSDYKGKKLIGIITDGDLRRNMNTNLINKKCIL